MNDLDANPPEATPTSLAAPMATESVSIPAVLSSSPAAYTWDYTYVPGVAMAHLVPPRDLPTATWIAQVTVCAFTIVRNRLKWAASQRVSAFEGAPKPTADLSHLGVLALDLEALPTEFEGHRSLASAVASRIDRPAAALESLETSRVGDEAFFSGALASGLAGLAAAVKTVVQSLTAQKIVDPLAILASVLKNVVDGPTGRATSLAQFDALFKTLPRPAVAAQWQSDEAFAWMRVAGFNPLVIRQTGAPGADFPVTEAHYRAALGDANDTLAQAASEGRLYLADYVALDGVTDGTFPHGHKFCHAPKALFALPLGAGTRRLKPVAIQCGQDPSAFTIFTPADGDAWTRAKLVVESADFTHHEMISHLGHTHLLVEPFVVATRRKLQGHWLEALLSPHFEGTLFINDAAHRTLIADGQQVDKLLGPTIQSSRAVAVASLAKPYFNAVMLPVDLKSRGVGSKDLDYPYRDDASLVWGAIERWVDAYVRAFCATDDDVANDATLAAWTADLVADDGGRVRGLGDGGDGRIVTIAYLVEAVTNVIFAASAQHAAVNFAQSGILTFTPNAPGGLYQDAPRSVGEAAGATLLDVFPPLDMAMLQMEFLTLLGGVHHTQLGGYDAGIFDARVANALATFKTELAAIEATIVQRDATRFETYPYLRPSLIPQSINI
jgi:arachidonate 15-lipoxygenase